MQFHNSDAIKTPGLRFVMTSGPLAGRLPLPSPTIQVFEVTSCYLFSSLYHFSQKPVVTDVPGGAVDKQRDLIQDFLLELHFFFFFLADDQGGRKLGYTF